MRTHMAAKKRAYLHAPMLEPNAQRNCVHFVNLIKMQPGSA
jgi:hypothetical protein